MNNVCPYCQEEQLNISEKSSYGAIVIYKNGDKNNGWFATLSPKTGGDAEKDFCIQLMPRSHISHISEINKDIELAKNYGVIFSKITSAINKIMKEENRSMENEENVIRIGVYGKSKHPSEHFHIKIFPWLGGVGQPYTVDTTFEKKEIFKENGEEFVKMKPVKKKIINEERLNYLGDKLIVALKS